jgi:hypothetical protein
MHVSSLFSLSFEIIILNHSFDVRFQVVRAASLKMTAFWDMEPCSNVEVDQRFRGT